MEYTAATHQTHNRYRGDTSVVSVTCAAAAVGTSTTAVTTAKTLGAELGLTTREEALTRNEILRRRGDNDKKGVYSVAK